MGVVGVVIGDGVWCKLSVEIVTTCAKVGGCLVGGQGCLE